MASSKFICKVVKSFLDGNEIFYLFLPDGRKVASGSLQHCLNERDHWEVVLRSNPVQLSLFD